MPMIDIYAAAGTFADIKQLSADAAALVKSVEQVPDIPMFRKEHGGLRARDAGDRDLKRGRRQPLRSGFQVLTNAGALDRDKQIALVGKMTDLIAAAANDPELKNAHVGAADRGSPRWLGLVGGTPRPTRSS